MTHLEAEARIPLPAAEYWSIRTTPEFFEIESSILGNESKTMLDEVFDAEGMPVRARMATKPDISFVPQYLRNMLPTEDKTVVLYDEVEFVYDDPLTPYAFRFQTIPNVFADRADIHGYVRIIPNPDGRTCTQSVTADVKLNAWGVATIVGTLIARGVTDGYAKLPLMVERWKGIAEGAFLKATAADEPQLQWGGKHDWNSEDEFFDADESDSGTDADDDSGVAHTDSNSISDPGDAHDTATVSSAENLLISQQPGEFDNSDRVRMGVERPEETSTWGLCGLGGLSLTGWWS